MRRAKRVASFFHLFASGYFSTHVYAGRRLNPVSAAICPRWMKPSVPQCLFADRPARVCIAQSLKPLTCDAQPVRVGAYVQSAGRAGALAFSRPVPPGGLLKFWLRPTSAVFCV